MISQTLDMKKELGKRSRLEMYADVLCAIADGAEKPTHVMFKANLSWPGVQACLKTMIKRGLIAMRQVREQKRYELTYEGFQALSLFLKLKERLGPSSHTKDSPEEETSIWHR